MTQEQFIAQKIPTLMKEGKYSRKQAMAISYAMYNKQYSQQGAKNSRNSIVINNQAIVGMQQGGKTYAQQANFWNMPNVNQTLQEQRMSPQQDFSQMGYNQWQHTPAVDKSNVMNYNVPAPNWYDQNKTAPQTGLPTSPEYDMSIYGRGDANLDKVVDEKDTVDKFENPLTPTQQPKKEMDFTNFLGGVGLEQSLYTFGQGLGEKNASKIAVGGALSALKIGRNGLGGYASGKENARVEQEYRDNLYKDRRQVSYGQQGGKIDENELYTNQFVVDNSKGSNLNVENGEFIKDNQTGSIKEAVGDNHKNGGIDTNLQDGKVLSNADLSNMKLGAKNARELKEKYKLQFKKEDTFAKGYERINKSLGADKLIDEQALEIERLKKNNLVADKNTRSLNEGKISKNIAEIEKKIEELKPAQNYVYEDIFARQEKNPKVGNGELLNPDGSPMQVKSEQEMAQQGGNIQAIAQKYGISPQRAMELMQMQQGGEQAPQQEMSQEQQIVMAFAEATQQDPQQIMEQLSQLQPEEQQQALQQMMTTLQGGQQSQQEEQAEGNMSNPQEEMQEMAQQGGKTYAQQGDWKDKLIKNKKYGVEAEKEYVSGAFEEPDYKYESIPDIAKRFKYLADQRGIDYSKIDLNTRVGVDSLAGLTQQYDKKNSPNLTQDYGNSIGLTKQGIDYLTTTNTFNSIEKTNPNLAQKLKNSKRGTYDVDNFTSDDRNIIMSEVEKSGDKTFADKNYLDNKAFFRGIDKQKIYFTDPNERDAWRKTKGVAKDGYYNTDKKGVYIKDVLLQPKEFKTEQEKLEWIDKNEKNKDGEHNQFFGENPNSDTYYTPTSPSDLSPSAKGDEYTPLEFSGGENTDRGYNNNGFGFMPYITPPDPRQGVILETVNPPQYVDSKRSFEQGQVALANQLDTQRQNMVAQGLPPQMQAAIMANESANSQMASNDNIAKVEQYNAANQQDIYNKQQDAELKTNIFNVNQRDEYFKRNTAAKDSQEMAQKASNDSWTNYGISKERENISRNLINAKNENYDVDAQGYIHLKANSPLKLSGGYSKEFLDRYNNATPEEKAVIEKEVNDKLKNNQKQSDAKKNALKK